MDELAYVAMTGAKQIVLAQGVNSHNLANATTVGFRADMHSFEARQVEGPGFASRYNAQAQGRGWSDASGELMTTGNPLDVAASVGGWFAVQAPDGAEAYTKAGDLRIDELGRLTNGAGHALIGDAGPIALPPFSRASIGTDGTISIIGQGQTAETAVAFDRLKLVRPAANELVKHVDGLMHSTTGVNAPADAGVSLSIGTLEASNVNVVAAMVDMIELARQFEIHVRMIDTANENAQAATSVMRLQG